MPIGKPWRMVAIDILSVPVSVSGNNCLLVQNYFTKWPDAIPLPNQKAIIITKALVNLFATIGMPQIVHSDQVQNFESTICLRTPLMHLGYVSHTQRPIIHKAMALLRGSIALFCNSSAHTLIRNLIGNNTYLLLCMFTGQQFTPHRRIPTYADVW